MPPSESPTKVSSRPVELPEVPEFDLVEIAKHNKEDDVWVVIHSKVYDVTKFIHDHPGGPDILLDVGGTDATENFEDIFHSDQARKMLVDHFIGNVKGAKQAEIRTETGSPKSTSDDKDQSIVSRIVLVVLIAIIAVLYQRGIFERIISQINSYF
eukprot:272482_1